MILIAGPCVGEQSEQWIVDNAGAIVEQIADHLDVSLIFKCSFDKANRTSGGSYRGLGLEMTLRALDRVKSEFGIMVTTDIHEPYQAREVASVVDIIQIPAMLCRQTDLILAAATRENVVNIKCGTGASAEEMEEAAAKVDSHAFLTYRGTAIANRVFFLPEQLLAQQEINHRRTVLLDVTHIARDATREPDDNWNPMSLIAAQCGLAMSVDGLFMECHPEPNRALSDRNTQIRTRSLATFLGEAGL
jgi:2-dehydro-3-deoxyphosphooctonate aldolase (KDO 8-P synthase)